MRLLRVAQKAYPDVTGGGPYHVHALSRDQAAMGHDVTVLTVGTGDGSPVKEQRNGYTVLRADAVASPLGNAIAPGVWRELRDGDYDVVHAHSHLYFSTNLAALSRRLGGPPLAITNHGLYSQTAPAWLFGLYLRTLGRLTFNAADTVFCYTEADRDRLRERGVRAPVTVVPNGVDTERFSPAGPTSEHVDHDGPLVLYVGRLVGGKRPGDAIAAVQRLADSLPDVRLYVCGDGPLRPDLEDRAGPETVFLGELPYDEMPAVYRGADAFVLPSRAEGTPRTVMEALACGVPVVASALPQIRAAFGDTISTVECGDVTGFSLELERLIGTEATAALDERFSWEQTVEATTSVLAKLAE